MECGDVKGVEVFERNTKVGRILSGFLEIVLWAVEVNTPAVMHVKIFGFSQFSLF